MMDALLGLDVTPPLPEGHTPLEVVVMVKCLDEDGDVVHLMRATEGLTSVECLGMAIATADRLRAAIAASFEEDD